MKRSPTRDRVQQPRTDDGSGAEGDSRPTVLVVDGDENVLRLLEIKLSHEGFSVRTAQEGEEGYIAARIGSPDVVVAGDALGPLDSHSLVRALSDLPVPPAIIFLSHHDGDEDVEHALMAGCSDYVLKPFSPHEMIHRVRVTLLRRRLASVQVAR